MTSAGLERVCQTERGVEVAQTLGTAGGEAVVFWGTGRGLVCSQHADGVQGLWTRAGGVGPPDVAPVPGCVRLCVPRADPSVRAADPQEARDEAPPRGAGGGEPVLVKRAESWSSPTGLGSRFRSNACGKWRWKMGRTECVLVLGAGGEWPPFAVHLLRP